MAKSHTQLSLIKEMQILYSEITSITEQLLQADFESSEPALLTARRGELIAQCETYFSQLESLPHGGSQESLVSERELLNQLILAAVADDKLLTEKFSKEKSQLARSINGASVRNRAVTSYGIHAKFGKL